MPTYEYKCEECGIVFERFQHFSEEPLTTCPECHGSVRRIIHSVRVIFKGSGFYVTDNRGDSSSLRRKPESKEGESSPKSTPSDDTSSNATETSSTDES